MRPDTFRSALGKRIGGQADGMQLARRFGRDRQQPGLGGLHSLMSLRFLLAMVLVVATATAAWRSPTWAQSPGAGSAPAGAAGRAPSSADRQYVLGSGDTIEAQVVGRTDFSARVQIGPDGSIQVPYLGTVQAAGRTAAQLSDELTKALIAGGYFSNPIMRVEVVSYASQYVTVLGAVVTPGLVPIDRAYHVSDIIARVGGTKDTAADYVVLRSQSGEEKRYSLRDLATGDASHDPLVWPGDKIFSPLADQFYVSGEVKEPGSYPLKSDMTLRMAIARGGGLTYRGTDRAVVVTRGGERLRDLPLDSKIEPGDVIVVGERFF
jgi:polysaccharide export outer membrane protein